MGSQPLTSTSSSDSGCPANQVLRSHFRKRRVLYRLLSLILIDRSTRCIFSSIPPIPIDGPSRSRDSLYFEHPRYYMYTVGLPPRLWHHRLSLQYSVVLSSDQFCLQKGLLRSQAGHTVGEGVAYLKSVLSSSSFPCSPSRRSNLRHLCSHYGGAA